MTTLAIMATYEKKRLKCYGTVAAGEHVAVTVTDGAQWIGEGKALRLRVLFGPNTVAVFPFADGDAWTAAGTQNADAYCELNLNTVQAEKYLKHGGTCLWILDDVENHTLYATGEFDVLPWPKRRGIDEPIDLDGYPQLIEDMEELKTAWAEYQTSIAQQLAAKQDVLSDLAAIRNGAAAGTTAIQPSFLLDGGKIKSDLLPSYVDDVIEVANYASLPNPGESGKIYVTLDTNKTYRWGGTAYVEISNPDLTEYAKRAELFPAWAANTAYTTYSLVIHENAIYKCTDAHTSGAEWDSTKWAVASGAEVLAMIRDYRALSNKPSINDVTLSGNKTAAQLGLATQADATLTPVYSQTPTFSEWTFSNVSDGITDIQQPVFVPSTGGEPRWEVTFVYDGLRSATVYVTDEDATNLAFEYVDEGLNLHLTATRVRTDIIGYQLGSQADKPLASEAEAEALRNGKLDKSAVVAPSSSATTGQAADAKATGDALEPLLFAQYYPDGSVKSAAEFTSGIKYDDPVTTNRTITVKPFCNTGDSADDNSGLVGRVVIPPFVDAQGNGYISDDGTKFKVVGVSIASPRGSSSNLTAIVAPNTVTTIRNYAFYNCTALHSVSLPAAENIGIGVFFNCSTLTSVDFGDTSRSPIPILGETAFNGVPNTCKIIVPYTQYDAWKATSGWSSLPQEFVRHAEKADKPATFTAGNLAALDASGNPTDSLIPAANVAVKSNIPYALGTPTVIDTASSETVEGETVYYGGATLANRTANIVQVTAATALDELRITFPSATSGKVRDFGLRVEVGTGSAALAAPALVPIAPTGETIKIENNAAEIPALADGTATAKGVTLLYFSETAPGVFVVKGEQVEEVA